MSDVTARSLLTTLEAMQRSVLDDGDEATAKALETLRSDVERVVENLHEDHVVFAEVTRQLLQTPDTGSDARLKEVARKARARLLAVEHTLTMVGETPADTSTPEVGDAGTDATSEVRVPESTWKNTLADAGLTAECADEVTTRPADQPAGDQVAHLERIYNAPMMRARLQGVNVLRVVTPGQGAAGPKGVGVYVNLQDGAWLADLGNTIKVGAPESDEALAAEIACLVAVAEAKGWHKVNIKGSPAFVQQADLALRAAGFDTTFKRKAVAPEQPAPAAPQM